MDVETERISLWIHVIYLGWVFQLLQDFPRSDSPAIGLDIYKGRRVIEGLEKIICFNVSGEIGCDELGVLSTGLMMVNQNGIR